ncbi:hypothetical protein MM213_00360 [Belliella sp. R4-6]|uniref:Uncharacterized protein n=1 Tax=Belliella alkalica TaxID=1730871 RepID=A0ABS9V673_9BACT|nr:hypothetical protein [Belliella alkalica]MCH7411917.1 hypothetical protein [Belliella alkalica]
MKKFIHPFKYRSNEPINFGQYKGIQIGIIFLYDPEYLEWLIREKAHFCIDDLDLILKNGVINPTIWVSKFKVMILQKDNMKRFSSYTKHIEEFKSYLQQWEIDNDVIKKNQENLKYDGTYKINVVGYIKDGKMIKYDK